MMGDDLIGLPGLDRMHTCLPAVSASGSRPGLYAGHVLRSWGGVFGAWRSEGKTAAFLQADERFTSLDLSMAGQLL